VRGRRALKYLLCALALMTARSLAAEQEIGFDVDVSLSARAAAELAARHEKINVWAAWYGMATEAAAKHADEMGQIDFGSETVLVSGAGGRAHLTGQHVTIEHLDWVQDRTVTVLVNVYSARLSSQDNLLDCGLFEDSVAASRAKPIEIACKLIGEQ